MCKNKRSSSIEVAILALSITIGVISFCQNSEPVFGQQTPQNPSFFTDVPQNYWARPYIQALAAEGIIAGYPDGSYRPENPMDRDEFAAVVSQAFNKDKMREIPSGSFFKDVSADYWAETPIQEAYETGFMGADSGELFRPQQNIPRIVALASLARGLNLNYGRPTLTSAQNAINQPNQVKQRPRPKYRLMFPLASTSLMQPVLSAQLASNKQKAVASPSPSRTTQTQSTSPGIAASNFVDLYYKDANKIPQNRINDVAAATQANIVVNYPEATLLNPNQPLKRSTAAALIYQGLVHQGRLQPLSTNLEATNYLPALVVQPKQSVQTAQ